MSNATRPALRRVPTPVAALAFLLLFAVHAVLLVGRKRPDWRSDALLAFDAGFYSHVSNFALSYVLVAGIGYMWLMLGVRMRLVWTLGAACAAANVVYELWIPILNTPDPRDAVYGLTGTALAMGVLLTIDRSGMRANPACPGT